MPDYRERLWPTPWIYVASLLFIPASILVLAPVSLPAGIVTGVLIYTAVVVSLSATAPVIEVRDGRLRAHLVIRGWVQPVVRVPIVDPEDPAPYWLVSTRHPKELAAAINGSRRPERTEPGA
jgi:hypothetical protein